jgi:hypothetical protein
MVGGFREEKTEPTAAPKDEAGPPSVPMAADLPKESTLAESTPVSAGTTHSICRECGNESPPDATFCDQCGALLGETSSAYATRPSLSQTPAATARSSFVLAEAQERLLFPSDKTELLIGREDAVSNVFPDINLEPFGAEACGVSRRHARLKLHGVEWQIEDLNSTNRSYVNKEQLLPGQPHPLHDGDRVRLGGLTLTFCQE